MAQDNWRFCNKCNALHFNGDPQNQICKAGGIHQRQGFIFHLDFDPENDLPDTPTTQSKWRFCNKCSCMFFQGAPPKDRHCAAGDSHQEQGFHFMLPINRIGGPVLNPEKPTTQGAWRFCGKCTTMFFDGFPAKGRCPADGQGHQSLGDTFVLPHDNSPSISLVDEGLRVRTDGRGFVPEANISIQFEFKVIQPDGPSTFHPDSGQARSDLDGNFNFEFSFGTSQTVNSIVVKAIDPVTTLSASGQLR